MLVPKQTEQTRYVHIPKQIQEVQLPRTEPRTDHLVPDLWVHAIYQIESGLVCLSFYEASAEGKVKNAFLRMLKRCLLSKTCCSLDLVPPHVFRPSFTTPKLNVL